MKISLDNFAPIARGPWRGYAQKSDIAYLEAALLNNTGLSPVPGGRGTTSVFDTSEGTAFMRRYKRGGAMRLLLHDRYLFDNRPLREFKLLLELCAESLLVPVPLGVCWRVKFGFYQGALATREIPGENLYDYLRNTGVDRLAALSAAGKVIRQMHDLHVWHADLQIRNIVISDGRAFLLDFDNARRMRRWKERYAQRNLLRLLRSFEKAGFVGGEFDALMEGYGDLASLGGLKELYRLKGQMSDLFGGNQNSDE